jgi:hypothetical protein
VARPRVSCLLMLFFVPFNFWVLTSSVCARALFPDSSSAPTSDSPTGGSGPQPAPSSPTRKSVTAPARPPSPPGPVGSGPGGPEPEATPREAEAAPQEEAARPATMVEEPAAVVAPEAIAGAPPAEPAAEEVAATGRQQHRRSQWSPALTHNPCRRTNQRWCTGGASSRSHPFYSVISDTLKCPFEFPVLYPFSPNKSRLKRCPVARFSVLCWCFVIVTVNFDDQHRRSKILDPS